MNYQSFVDHIIAEGCSWKRAFDARGVYTYHLYHNMQSGKSSYLQEQSGETIGWEAALLFCREIGIDPPADLLNRLDDFEGLEIPE